MRFAPSVTKSELRRLAQTLKLLSSLHHPRSLNPVVRVNTILSWLPNLLTDANVQLRGRRRSFDVRSQSDDVQPGHVVRAAWCPDRPIESDVLMTIGVQTPAESAGPRPRPRRMARSGSMVRDVGQSRHERSESELMV